MSIAKISKQAWGRIGLVLIISVCVILPSSAQQLNAAVQTVTETNNSSASSQQTVDRLNDQTEELLVQYRTVISEIESLRVYNQQLENFVNDQQLQIQSIRADMEDLESTNRGVVPLIIEMVDMLRQMIAADIPFLKEEREDRVASLEEDLEKSNVTTSEKYRKVTEAYKIELDYGSSVSTYEAELSPGKKVRFLQIGRTALLYQTFDEKTSGWWNPNSKQFEELPERYNSAIKKGIRIAAKQAAPDLVGLPILVNLSGE